MATLVGYYDLVSLIEGSLYQLIYAKTRNPQYQ